MKQLKGLKNLYNSGKIVLTEQLLERTQAYLEEEKFLEAIGWARNRMPDQKELLRLQREGHTTKLKEIEYKKQFSKKYKD